MAAKRLAVLVVLSVVLGASCWAQVNEVSLTVGRSFVSTQTVPSTNLPIHFGNEESFAFNYGRLLLTRGILGVSAELPVAIYPRMDLNYNLGLVPKDIGAVFVTPSIRANLFSGQGVSLPAPRPLGRRRLGALLPRRPVRDAAADVEHVPPFPRSRRLPSGASQLHLG